MTHLLIVAITTMSAILSDNSRNEKGLSCGPAATLLMANAMGRELTVEKVLERKSDLDLTESWSIQEIADVLSENSIDTTVVKTELQNKLRLTRPFVLHMRDGNIGHFVVVAPHNRKFLVMDPLHTRPLIVSPKNFLEAEGANAMHYCLIATSDLGNFLGSNPFKYFWLCIGLIFLCILALPKLLKSFRKWGWLLLLFGTLGCGLKSAPRGLIATENDAGFTILDAAEIHDPSDPKLYSEKPFEVRLVVKNLSKEELLLRDIGIANPCCSPGKIARYTPSPLKMNKTGIIFIEVNLQSRVGEAAYSLVLVRSDRLNHEVVVNRRVQIVPSKGSELQFMGPANFGTVRKAGGKVEKVVTARILSTEKIDHPPQLEILNIPSGMTIAIGETDPRIAEAGFGGYTIQIPIVVTIDPQQFPQTRFDEDVVLKLNGMTGTVDCYGTIAGEILVGDATRISFPIIHDNLARRKFVERMTSRTDCRLVSIHEADSNWLRFSFSKRVASEHEIKVELGVPFENIPTDPFQMKLIVELEDLNGTHHKEVFACPIQRIVELSSRSGAD